MTLRLRLLLVLVGIVAAGLLVADVATYASLRSYLFSQVDRQLVDDIDPVTASAVCQAEGFSVPFCRHIPGVVLPPGLWVQIRDPSGNVIVSTTGYPLAPPSLPNRLPGSGSSAATVSLFDTGGTGGSEVSYRVLAKSTVVEGTSVTAVVAIPLNDVHHTLGRLLLIEALVSGAVLIGMGALAWWVVRRGLRPLEEMAATAGAIAAGDLSQRVEATDERTEVGQLGQALNTMLTGIEGAFAARAASEERLRLFLADASHELRTPLTSIRGYAELFDRGARDRPEDLATSMRHIREEANRMSVLVDDLLLLARLDRQRPLELEPLDLGEVVVAAVDAARVSAPDRTIAYEPAGPAPVVGDALRLRQVADNLIANAVQHTPAGTPVEVRLGLEPGAVRLEVRDHGPGVPPEEQAKIFEPFHRADPTRARATGGVGLGLTIVSAIAHAHGGGAGVISEEAQGNGSDAAGPDGGQQRGPGATFWVRIPLAGSGTAGSGTAGSGTAGSGAGGSGAPADTASQGAE